MPIIIAVGSILLTLFCVIHAVRTGRTQPWIYIIVFLPDIGSIAYLLIEVLPDALNSRHGRAAQRGIVDIADPDRGLRKAKRGAEMVASADAKKALAEEYFERGNFALAIDMYRAALTGIHKDDPALLYGLARTQLAAGDGAGAQASLDQLQTANPDFASADGHLLYARALEAQSKDKEAQAEYEKLIRYFSGEEARCRYALLLKRAGHADHAREVFNQVLKSVDGAPRHYVRAQREWSDLARQNLAQ